MRRGGARTLGRVSALGRRLGAPHAGMGGTGAVAALLLLTALLTGCSTSPSLSTVSASPAPSSPAIPFTFTVMSSAKALHKAGPEDQITYGWNDLFGPTTLEGQPATVEVQCSIWYVRGSGPVECFITFTASDGSVLGTKSIGTGAKAVGSDMTRFAADLVVIGGTGRYANAAGYGEWTALRDGALGGAVSFDGRLTLTS